MLVTPDTARALLAALPRIDGVDVAGEELVAELEHVAAQDGAGRQADDPAPDSPVARIRDAVNDAYDAAVAEYAPDAGIAFVAALSVATDGGDALNLDTRTTVRVDLARLEAAGVELGAVNGPAVVMALMGALAEDAATALDRPNPRLN